MAHATPITTTIPAPAAQCAYLYPSGKLCRYNAVPGCKFCVMHIAHQPLRERITTP